MIPEDERRDMVNHPCHYGGEDNPYEVIKVLVAWGLDKDFALGSSVKYVARAGKKSTESLVQDLKKARWYLDWKIKKLESEGEHSAQARHAPFAVFHGPPGDVDALRALVQQDPHGGLLACGHEAINWRDTEQSIAAGDPGGHCIRCKANLGEKS